MQSSSLVLCLMGPDNTIIQEYIEISDEGVFLEKAPDLLFPNLHSLVVCSIDFSFLFCILIVNDYISLVEPNLPIVMKSM